MKGRPVPGTHARSKEPLDPVASTIVAAFLGSIGGLVMAGLLGLFKDTKGIPRWYLDIEWLVPITVGVVIFMVAFQRLRRDGDVTGEMQRFNDALDEMDGGLD